MNRYYLVFGLGYGYHIEKLEHKLKSTYSNSYRIFVIEPNKNLVQEWRKLRPNQLSPRVKIVNYPHIKSYYRDKELVDFLSEKPNVFSHPPSLQLNESFFKDFMSFHYPTTIEESLYFIENENYNSYLSSENPKETTEELFYRVKNKDFLKDFDYLTLALSELVQRRNDK